MKKSIIHIYESPYKSEVLYLDITKKVEISDEWKNCRVATSNDMKQLSRDKKVELKTAGYVVKKSIKLRTTEKQSNININT